MDKDKEREGLRVVDNTLDIGKEGTLIDINSLGGFTSEDAPNSMVLDYLKSPDWWCIVNNLEMHSDSDYLHEIEKEFYWNEKNKDFVMMFLNMGVVFGLPCIVVFAKKEHMSKNRLMRVLDKYYEGNKSFLKDDVVFPYPKDAPIVAYNVMANKWKDYVKGLEDVG